MKLNFSLFILINLASASLSGGFLRSPSDSKSTQLSSALVSILVKIGSAVVWTVSIIIIMITMMWVQQEI